MDRRESIKTLLLGTASLSFLKQEDHPENQVTKINAEPMRSLWSDWPDMKWAGPEYWGNRLQDWQIRDGKAECAITAPNRTLHLLTHQLNGSSGDFKMSVQIDFLIKTGLEEDNAGFRIGARAEDQPVRVEFKDYRRNAVFGEGLDAGIDGSGRLFIGGKRSEKPIELQGAVRLELIASEAGGSYRLKLTAADVSGAEQLTSLTAVVDPEQLNGNVALLSHFSSGEEEPVVPSVRFSDWRLSGNKVSHHPGQTFGPVCFAQYTLDRGVLKMTAQLAPVESVEEHSVELQIRRDGQWKTVEQTTSHRLARTAHFRVEGWNSGEEVPYRVRLMLPLKTGNKEYFYEGTIAAEPISADQLKTAVFSCNSHYGFPNSEVVENVTKHRPDMAVFLGDQIYESHGGFGVERTDDVELATLDYLRKWYMFGWSYRDLFRHIPSAFIPDDHDVFHGNIWGEGGKPAPTDEGWNYQAQDQGGYKYPAEWVRMVERTLTSHLPDPFDPTPVKQDIGVYYTDWIYGGISFAILEDRKFKTAPQNILPEDAQIVNGFIQNRDFDIRQYYEIDADLLGERQMDFLKHWVADWGHGARMKAVFSQTNFCTLATLPEGSILDDMVPGLEIPERGEYVKGDAPTTDMDSNGWPMKERDNALRTIRKGFALHIAGDQHLASTVHYGVEEHGDAGFGFAGPALNNLWPRRWWPPVGSDHHPMPGRSKNTGPFEDGFGNKMTVYAVANPVQTNRKPGLIYDRVTGYGMVIFDKKERTIRIECWPRYVDPQANPEGQYEGWPVIIKQQENYGRKAAGYLPELRVEGMEDPVIEVHNQQTGELEYALRIEGTVFKPKIFDEGNYRIRVGEPDENRWQEFEDLGPTRNGETINCIFE